MDEPIIVSYRWSAKEMLLAQGVHMRYSEQGRKLRRFFIGGGILFLVLGISTIVVRQSFLTGVFPFLLLAAMFFCMPFFMRRAVLKAYAQKPDRDMLITYEISSDRLNTRSEIAVSDMLWRIISRVHRVPEGFLLYQGERMFHWLPLHGFRDVAEIERFAVLVKAKVQQYADATK